jgi:hypothetical protein
VGAEEALIACAPPALKADFQLSKPPSFFIILSWLSQSLAGGADNGGVAHLDYQSVNLCHPHQQQTGALRGQLNPSQKQ